MLDRLPKTVSVYEVSPRDGLQNEALPVDLAGKLALIEALVEAGLRRIEVTSFVSPRWIPQLSDADELCRTIKRRADVTFSALVPNSKGLERAIAAGLSEVAVFLSATETHTRKNTNKTIEQAFAAFEEVVGPAISQGLRVRGYVSTVWGCPYEGPVEPTQALRVAERLLNLGCYQVSLGDTIGVGTPRQTQELLELFLKQVPSEKIALHLHDTRGTALANALVGLDMGIQTLDTSVAGLGGCPYAPGAAGNLPTEDLVYMLEGMGIETGIDLDKLIQAGETAERIIGRRLPGRVHQAGAFRQRTSARPPT